MAGVWEGVCTEPLPDAAPQSESCCLLEFGIAGTWENRGRMVTPAWPPTTGTSTSATFRPAFCA